VLEPCWPRNGRSVTFSLGSVQIALVFEVAHGDLNTSSYTLWQNICLIYWRFKMRQFCSCNGACWPKNGWSVTFSLVSVQKALVFEVAHGDLNTSSYTPKQTFVFYIDKLKCDSVALAMEPCWPRNGRSVTFSLVSVQKALVFEVAHGDLNTSSYTP
jgi:hypothetical protein